MTDPDTRSGSKSTVSVSTRDVQNTSHETTSETGSGSTKGVMHHHDGQHETDLGLDRRSRSIISGKGVHHTGHTDYEECYFDRLTKKEWRAYKKLHDVLEKQLVHLHKATRATQTQWRWRMMAERWKHARVIHASEKPYVAVVVEEAPVDPDTAPPTGHTLIIRSAAMSGQSTEDKEREEMEKKKKEKLMVEIYELRKTRQCDKVIDTSDLDFNPYDKRVQFTKLRSVLETIYGPDKIPTDPPSRNPRH